MSMKILKKILLNMTLSLVLLATGCIQTPVTSLPSESSGSGDSKASSMASSADSGTSGENSSIEGSGNPDIDANGFRGVYFNSPVQVSDTLNGMFGIYDPSNREIVRAALASLVQDAGINLIDVFVVIPNTLKNPPQGNKVGQSIEEWADLSFLDSIALFIEDCHDEGISVELDLADNRWIPYAIDSATHIGKPESPYWPMADDTPWDESALWYSQIIEYVEAKTTHPESIAMWGMMGQYQLGMAEPVLWSDDYKPGVLIYTEKFVKYVWPIFKAAGNRPKIAPYAFPIFSDNSYWMVKTPDQRLEGFSNIKKWLADDLKLLPDYWGISTYPYCDPAPDGFYYLKRAVEIIGEENASHIVTTDFKAIGKDLLKNSIITSGTHTSAEMLEWNFQKAKEYGFAGWWIWRYSGETGVCELDGSWKPDLLKAIQDSRTAK